MARRRKPVAGKFMANDDRKELDGKMRDGYVDDHLIVVVERDFGGDPPRVYVHGRRMRRDRARAILEAALASVQPK